MLQGRSKAQLLVTNYHKAGGQTTQLPLVPSTLYPKTAAAIYIFLQPLDICMRITQMQTRARNAHISELSPNASQSQGLYFGGGND